MRRGTLFYSGFSYIYRNTSLISVKVYITTANGCHFQLRLSHKAAKSIARLTSQLCDGLQTVRLSACQGKESFTNHLSTPKCLTSLRNKPQ